MSVNFEGNNIPKLFNKIKLATENLMAFNSHSRDRKIGNKNIQKPTQRENIVK